VVTAAGYYPRGSRSRIGDHQWDARAAAEKELAQTQCYNTCMNDSSREATPPRASLPPVPEPQPAAARTRDQRNRTVIFAAVAAAVVLLALLVLAIYALLQPNTPTERIRDVFVIVVALETLIIGVALIVLLLQLASLINLLQNEIRPILRSATETVDSLRGTTDFLGETVVEPVIKLNSYLASIQRVLELIGIKRF
jgi:hypothetical protein